MIIRIKRSDIIHYASFYIDRHDHISKFNAVYSDDVGCEVYVYISLLGDIVYIDEYVYIDTSSGIINIHSYRPTSPIFPRFDIINLIE